jgi:transcriptional regulator with XRE-family HTH domain
MIDHNLTVTIRGKKLGILIRNARTTAAKSLEDTAAAVGVTPQEFQAFELGEAAPSLPQLELLAYHFNLPLEHFWGQAILNPQEKNADFDPRQLVKLRQRMIGVMIRKARLEAGFSQETLTAKAGLLPGELEAFERGEKPVPVPLLEALTPLLNRTVKDFQDRQGPVGTWMARQRAASGLTDMPENLASFISKPINRPYLELALRLSEMSVEKLRAVAEGLLEITL